MPAIGVTLPVHPLSDRHGGDAHVGRAVAYQAARPRGDSITRHAGGGRHLGREEMRSRQEPPEMPASAGMTRGRADAYFDALIQASIFASSTDIGSAPVSSTWAWKARGSNFVPNSCFALALSLRMVSAPIL